MVLLRSAYNETSLQDEGVTRAKLPYIGRCIDQVRLRAKTGKTSPTRMATPGLIISGVHSRVRSTGGDHGAVPGHSQAE